MCGRYSLHLEWSDIRALWEGALWGGSLNLTPERDVRPTAFVPAIASDENRDPERVSVHWITWGIKPDWSKSLLINAKAETITGGKRSFWHDNDWRPCLVPADAYYEWRAVDGQRRKQRVAYRVGDEPFTMAGLERLWKTPTGWLMMAVIITTKANALAAAVHPRMPVIIPSQRRAEWILGPRDHHRFSWHS